ncbi:RHS repeat-associated core domain-containing protein [Luteimonas aquatica]|uniref:RHS repeat-associated core domain-containing protein n=1 Tax=Luteimonas aquatica TaxID=450364 RepID=UPI001F5A80C8|nr:RHS repeat-associated core domain-containing protein [Luteimonas aquatica]
MLLSSTFASRQHDLESSRISTLWNRPIRWLKVSPLLLVVFASVIWPAEAEYIEEKAFCYGSQCFESLAQAEAKMREESVYGDLLYLKESTISNQSDSSASITFKYNVRDQPPETLYPPAFSPGSWADYLGCAPSEWDPIRCADESEAVERSYTLAANEIRRTSPSCIVGPYRIIGSHGDPFTQTYNPQQNEAYLHHFVPDNLDNYGNYGRRYEYDVSCPNEPSTTNAKQINKLTLFSCAAGFSPIIGYNPAYKPGQKPVIEWPYLCKAMGPFPTIVGKVKQVDSCPANNNPCHPATGDKSRSEIDFNFAGHSFTRFYHSLKQFADISGFPAGWTHTYSEKLYYQPNLSPSWLRTSDGYYDSFLSLGSSKYRLKNSPDRILFVLNNSGNTKYRIKSIEGETKDFDAKGRLISISNTQSPQNDVALSYIDTNSDDYLLDKVTDRNNRSISFEYKNQNIISRIVLPDGTAISYGYDEDSNLISVSHADGGVRHYSYHENGLSGTIFKNHLTGISDNEQRYATFSYDGYGRIKSSQLHGPNGYVEQTTLTYDTADKVTVTTPTGGERTYTLQPGVYRRPLSVVGGPDAIANTYETDGRVKTRTYANGATTSFTYQPAYQSSITEATGTPSERKTVLTRDSANRLTRREHYALKNGVQTLQQIELWNYDTNGQEIANCLVDPAVPNTPAYACGSQSNAPLGVRQTRTTYCQAADVTAGICPIAGLVVSIDGPRTDLTDVTNYTYYPDDATDCAIAPTTCSYRKGDLKKTTDALGHVTETLRYDGAGRPLSIKAPNGAIADYEYSTRGWLLTHIARGADPASESDDQISRFEYWPAGMIKKIIQPDGSFISYSYDSAHRLIGIADNSGNTIQYELDAAGNRIKENTKDPAGIIRRTMSNTYNSLNQLLTIKDAYDNSTNLSYDSIGGIDTVIDPRGYITNYDHDHLNRPVRIAKDTSGINAETRFNYDGIDNISAISDPKNLNTTYAYNGLGDLMNLSSPDTGLDSYTYDSAGNRETKTDARGITSLYSYDALNRLAHTTQLSDESATSYTYDTVNSICGGDEHFSIGLITKITDGSGSTKYCYDRFDRVTRKVQTTGDKVFDIRYSYTKTGKIQSITYPDGILVDYVRNSLGQISEIGVTKPQQERQLLLDQASYSPFGPVTGWRYGNDRRLIYALDLNYNPMIIRSSNANGFSLHFNFDASGNLIQLDNADQSAILARYRYDALDRLTETQDGLTGIPIEQYSYDSSGNRTGLTNTNGTTDYIYPSDSHHLTGVGGAARTYDNAGNTLNIGGSAKEFTYNGANRISQVRINGVIAMNYTYNGRGEQVRKSLDTTNIYVVYDEAGRWLGDYDSNGRAIQQAIWLDDLPVGLMSGFDGAQTLYYLEPDHLGTPRAVIDISRNDTIWSSDIRSEVFGDTPPNEDPDNDGAIFQLNMRFPGQIYDRVSDLNYNYFRDYEPSIGRYIQSDPIGLDAGPSTYSYVEGDPLDYADPFGLDRILVRRPWWWPSYFPYPGEEQLPQRHYSQPDPWDRIVASDGTTSRDWGRANGRAGRNGKWCVIKCKGEQNGVSGRGRTQGECLCPNFIYGLGLGRDVNEAWNNAWDAANMNTPPGCMKKHCSGMAGSCRGRRGGKI